MKPFFLYSCYLSFVSGNLIWSLRDIHIHIYALIPLHDPNLGVFLSTIQFYFSRLLGPIYNALVIAARIDPEDTTDIVTITRDREFTECISPLIEEAAYGFTNLVFAVLGVVASAGDGIDGARRGAVLEEDGLKVGNGFVWVET